MTQRVLIYGGRDFGNFHASNLWPAQRAIREAEYRAGYDFLSASFPDRDVVVIQGGATGADRIGADWAGCSECAMEEYRAEWGRWGRAAGSLRNHRMLSEGKPDIAVQFPGGRGTADMRRRLQAAGIPIIEYRS